RARPPGATTVSTSRSRRSAVRIRALAVVILVLLPLGVVYAQDQSLQKPDQPFQKMIGTWKGKLDVHDDPDQTLLIKWIAREGDIWVASIEYGPTGKTLSSMAARVEKQGGTTTLSFPLSTTRKIDLSLISERELRGLLKISVDGSWVARKMVLQKTADK